MMKKKKRNMIVMTITIPNLIQDLIMMDCMQSMIYLLLLIINTIMSYQKLLVLVLVLIYRNKTRIKIGNYTFIWRMIFIGFTYALSFMKLVLSWALVLIIVSGIIRAIVYSIRNLIWMIMINVI